MGWAGFDGGVGGEGGSHALRAQGSNGDAHGRCAQKWQSLSQPPPGGATAAGGESAPKKHPNKAPK